MHTGRRILPDMWEGRADGAKRDIAALVKTGLGVAELHTAAIAVVDRVVPVELACWASSIRTPPRSAR